MKLRTKLILSYSIITFCTIFFVGTFLFQENKEIVVQDAKNATKTAVEQSASYIEMYVEQMTLLSNILSTNPSTRRYIETNDTEAETDLLELIDTSLSSDSQIQSIIVVSKDGRIVSNEEKLHMSVSKDMLKQPWYVATLKSNTQMVVTSAQRQPFSSNKNEWVISMSREIRDENRNHLGVVLIDISYKGLAEYLRNLNLGKDGQIFILNRRNEVVYHENPSYFASDEKRQQLVQICEAKDGYNEQKGEVKYQYEIKNTDWRLVGMSSLDSLQQIQKQLIRIFLLCGTIAFIIIVTSATWISNRTTKPFNDLISAMKNVEKGVLQPLAVQHSTTEFQRLTIHFNTMVKQIQQLLRQVEEKERDRRAYELQVLHSQINPHFLYNTLDTIVWMAEFEDTERVISITKSLASFFQLSLNGGNDMTTVQKELEHVSHYLYIQKERYEEQLQYEFQVDDDVQLYEMPKILLQPIVENSIYHGIRELSKPGNITIRVWESQSKLYFEIKDNGVGFDVNAPYEKDTNRKLGGVGMNNVAARIQLYYGEQYGLRVESEKGEGTTVTIVLPARKNDKKEQ